MKTTMTRAERIEAAMLSLGRAKLAVEAAYRAGKVDWRRVSVRCHRLTVRRIKLENARRVPEFQAGDVVEDCHGTALTIEGATLGDWSGSGVFYRTVDARGVHDLRPASVIRYALGGR